MKLQHIALGIAATLPTAARASQETYEKHAPKLVFGLDAPHLHLLTNHIPIFVTFSGLIVMSVALRKRDHLARQIALVLVSIGNAGALLTYWLGQQSYKAVRGLADESGQDWLDLHMERAERVVWLYWLALVVSVAALVWCWRGRRFTALATWAATAFAAISLGLAGWIADAGGKIRHSEFRGMEPTPEAEEAPHSH
ncbi:hypothetical protein [Haloferula sp. BvORR071]|uniref:hypothetical protein n=1 Tax=Haloferula sp. BvORR071 TaxID=1396141 RepID=UPI0006974DA3|nr:hypothetical protein [Haloferula sp. BvORR071]